MEFEILSDAQIEWQARRVMAAFEVKKFTRQSLNDSVFSYKGRVGRNTVRWMLSRTYGPILSVDVGKGRIRCGAFCSIGGLWRVSPSPTFNEHMARGLYRLGIEDKALFVELNHPLSMHEKLELRLSLPREFWPKKWLDEEEA